MTPEDWDPNAIAEEDFIPLCEDPLFLSGEWKEIPAPPQPRSPRVQAYIDWLKKNTP